MTQNPGKLASPADLRVLDIYEFAKSGRQAAGALRVSQMLRMLAEVPADVPDRGTVFTWQAEGSTQPELQDDGTEAPQPYLHLAVHGSVWLMCQRCLSPYSQHLDVDATYRIVATEEEADEYPLDDDEVEVIVGSRQFDLVDLIEEELLLSLPLVPKHNVCPEVHESLLPGDADDESDKSGERESGERGVADEDEKPNPFAVLEKLKQDGSDDKKALK
ncbi:MAG: FIG01269488: protein, clustered with ribosomal protein L32p [uncultured Caballeronia sp.]|nr:MAG: FIG01269488: protein, clustered with ribosomal protein L32p [uncultured Caballeronia sp.]